jgi:hypothetical protein
MRLTRTEWGREPIYCRVEAENIEHAICHGRAETQSTQHSGRGAVYGTGDYAIERTFTSLSAGAK